MEMIKTNGFCEMTTDEMTTVDGGVTVLAAAAAIAAVGGALGICYKGGTVIGKFIKNLG